MPVDSDGYIIVDNGTTKKAAVSTIKGTIVNNLEQTTAGSQLDARQGVVLNNKNNENVAALSSITSVINSKLAENRRPQMMRLPGTDTSDRIPATASDMLLIMYYFPGNGQRMFSALYNPDLGFDKKVHVGGMADNNGHMRITADAKPGGQNTIRSGYTYSPNYTLKNTYINFFKTYDPDAGT